MKTTQRRAAATEREAESGPAVVGGRGRGNAARQSSLQAAHLLGGSEGLWDKVTDWTCDVFGLGCDGEEGARFASATTDEKVMVGSIAIGPFKGDAADAAGAQRPRAAIIADRLNERGGSVMEPAVVGSEGPSALVLDTHGDLFRVTTEDARAGGFHDTRLAAWTWLCALTGGDIPAGILDGDDKHLSASESTNLEQFRQSAVQVQEDDSILVHGIRIGPFTGTTNVNNKDTRRSEVIADRLRAVATPDLRSAQASGPAVTVGTQQFTVTAADAAAMTRAGERALSPEAAALRVCEQLDGTWVRGDIGRQDKDDDVAARMVLSPDASPAFLYEIALALATGPGRSNIDTRPNQVSLLALRGVNKEGAYNPGTEKVDDSVIAFWVDAAGSRHAQVFQAVVDPSNDYGANASQVGDVAHDYVVDRIRNSWHTNGTGRGTAALMGTGTHLGSQNDAIETRSASSDRELEAQTGAIQYRTDTKIHLGGGPGASAGCTIITDNIGGDPSGAARARGREIADIAPQQLDATIRAMSVEQLAILLEDEALDETTRSQIRTLHQVRTSEATHKAGGLSSVTAIPNFEAFLSICYRDPEVNLRYVVVDGSKIPSFCEQA